MLSIKRLMQCGFSVVFLAAVYVLTAPSPSDAQQQSQNFRPSNLPSPAPIRPIRQANTGNVNISSNISSNVNNSSNVSSNNSSTANSNNSNFNFNFNNNSNFNNNNLNFNFNNSNI